MSGLPYIDIPQKFGPVSTFGLLLVAGLLFAGALTRRYATRNGEDLDTLAWLTTRVVAWGFFGALALDIAFYEPSAFLADPWGTIKKLGISSYGGGLAGALAFIFYAGRKGLDRRRWGDLLAYGVAGGYLFGRLGCAVAHDHLGRKTDFALGVNVPPGRYPFDRADHVIRAHDLGLYEFFVWIVIVAALLVLERWRGRRPGFLVGFMAVVYSPPRFFLEFLRLDSSDPRYGGLTFAQWASIAIFIAGMYLLFKKPGREAEVKEEAKEEAKGPRKKATAGRAGGRRAGRPGPG